jgi:hypothetical protein
VAAAPSSTARSPILRGPSSTASVVQMRSAGVVTLRFVPYEIPSSTAPARPAPSNEGSGDGTPRRTGLVPRESTALRPMELLY